MELTASCSNLFQHICLLLSRIVAVNLYYSVVMLFYFHLKFTPVI